VEAKEEFGGELGHARTLTGPVPVVTLFVFKTRTRTRWRKKPVSIRSAVDARRCSRPGLPPGRFVFQDGGERW
jgi:hypothetical protein